MTDKVWSCFCLSWNWKLWSLSIYPFEIYLKTYRRSKFKSWNCNFLMWYRPYEILFQSLFLEQWARRVCRGMFLEFLYSFKWKGPQFIAECSRQYSTISYRDQHNEKWIIINIIYRSLLPSSEQSMLYNKDIVLDINNSRKKVDLDITAERYHKRERSRRMHGPAGCELYLPSDLCSTCIPLPD